MKVMNSDLEVSKYKPSILKQYLVENTGLSVKECDLISKNITNQIYKKFDDVVSTDVLKSLVLNNLIKRGELGEVSNNTVFGLTGNEFEDLLSNNNTSNANHFRTAEQVHHYANEAVSKKYALSIMPEECKEAYLRGSTHIHDLATYATKSNCMNYDIRWFLRNGLMIDGVGHHGSVANSANSLKVLLNHMLQVFMAGACCLSGGQSFSHFNTFLAPMCKGMSYSDIKQEIQGFVYNCNMSLLSRGAQLCFSSINLNLTIPSYLKDEPAIGPGGIANGVYGDYDNEFDMIFKAVCEVLEEGDGNGNYHRFPNTVCVIEDPSEVAEYKGNIKTFIELANKNGFVYFANNASSKEEIGVYMGCVIGNEIVEIMDKDGVAIYSFKDLIDKYSDNEYGVINVEDDWLMVKSIDDDYNICWTPVHNLIHNPPRKVYEVILNNGLSFVCDESHGLITPELDKIDILKSIGEDVLIIDEEATCVVGEVISISFYGYEETYCLEANGRMIIGDDDNMILTSQCRTSMKNNYSGDWEKDCLNTGNFMYNTINLPMLSMMALESGNDPIDEFFNLLDNECEITYTSLKHRKSQVEKAYYDYGLGDFLVKSKDNDSGEPLYDFDRLSYTIGYVGLNECLINLFDGDVVDCEDEGVAIIEFINLKAKEFKDRDGLRWSVIGSAAENCCYTLAKKTLEKYPDCAYNGSLSSPYFTNSSHINVKSEQSISTQILNASVFHDMSLAGHILHLWMGEAFSDAEALFQLTKKIINKTTVRFWDYNKDYFVCFDCGYSVGTVDGIDDYEDLECPICKSNDCEVYSRCTGYFTPVSSFNDGKKQEFKDRFRL